MDCQCRHLPLRYRAGSEEERETTMELMTFVAQWVASWRLVAFTFYGAKPFKLLIWYRRGSQDNARKTIHPLKWRPLSYSAKPGPRARADPLCNITGPGLDRAWEVKWLAINGTWKEVRLSMTYHTDKSLYSFLGSISRWYSSRFLSKSKVDRTDATASVRVEWATCFPTQILPGEGRWY